MNQTKNYSDSFQNTFYIIQKTIIIDYLSNKIININNLFLNENSRNSVFISSYFESN